MTPCMLAHLAPLCKFAHSPTTHHHHHTPTTTCTTTTTAFPTTPTPQAELRGQLEALAARFASHEAAELAGKGVASQQELQVSGHMVGLWGFGRANCYPCLKHQGVQKGVSLTALPVPLHGMIVGC